MVVCCHNEPSVTSSERSEEQWERVIVVRVNDVGVYLAEGYSERFGTVASETGEPLPVLNARGLYRVVWGGVWSPNSVLLGSESGGIPLTSNLFVVP